MAATEIRVWEEAFPETVKAKCGGDTVWVTFHRRTLHFKLDDFVAAVRQAVEQAGAPRWVEYLRRIRPVRPEREQHPSFPVAEGISVSARRGLVTVIEIHWLTYPNIQSWNVVRMSFVRVKRLVALARRAS